MTERHSESEHMAHLIMKMENHVAFLEGALGINMTPVFEDDDLILSEIEGMNIDRACSLAFASSASESAWMDDRLVFNNITETVTFLDNVELLFRIARAQQRGA